MVNIYSMQLFYTPDIQDDMTMLSPQEARHCVQVLRKRVGDILDLVDGKGSFYKAEILEAAKKQCLVKIIEQRQVEPDQPALHIAIAPTKNIDRFEWFLEKATEIGITTITPLLCARSERKRVRLDRLQKVLLAAMKQSLKAHLPVLNELTAFKDFIKKHNPSDQKFIAYCNEDSLTHLQKSCLINQTNTIMIGPEGDFTKEEVSLALENGYNGISLGKSRLRTETAGLFATSIFNLVNSK